MPSALERFVERLTDNYDKGQGGNVHKLAELSMAAMQEQEDALQVVEVWQDVDRAEGTTLDMHGRDVLQDRGQASDEVYRVLIKSKVLRLLSDGSIDVIIDFIAFILDCDPKEVKVEELWADNLYLERENLLGTRGGAEDGNTGWVGFTRSTEYAVSGAYGWKRNSTSSGSVLEANNGTGLEVGGYYVFMFRYMVDGSTNWRVFANGTSGSVNIPLATDGRFYCHKFIHTGGGVGWRTGGAGFNMWIDEARLFKVSEYEYNLINVDPLFSGESLEKRYRYTDSLVKAAAEPTKTATLRITAPAGPISRTGLSGKQFGTLLNLVIAGGVRAEAQFEGTFRFSSIPNTVETSPEGFANPAQTSGGTLGMIYNPDTDYELPI